MKSRSATKRFFGWLRSIVSLLYRHRGVVLGVTAAATASAFVIQHLHQTPHRATACLHIETVSMTDAKKPLDPNAVINELKRWMRQDGFPARIVRKTNMLDRPERWMLSRSGISIASGSRTLESLPPTTQSVLTSALLSQMTVRGDTEKKDLIYVEFTSPDQVASASVANAIAEEIAAGAGYAASIPPEDRETFAKIDAGIRQIDEQIEALKEGQNVADMVESISDTVLRQTEMVDRLRTAEAEAVESEMSYNSLFQEDGTVRREILQSENLDRFREQWKEIDAKWQDVSKRYRRRHPTYIALQRQRDALETEIRNEENRVIERAKARQQQARSTLTALEEQHKELTEQLEKANQRYSTILSLEEELERLRSERQAFSERVNQEKGSVENGESIGIKEVQVYSWAQAPATPQSRSPRFVLLISLLCGLCGGIALACLVEFHDRKVRSPDEASRASGLPTVSAIPIFKIPRPLSVSRITQDLPHSPAAGSFRLLGRFLDPILERQGIRKISLCSAQPGEGKTTLAVNLASVLAQRGHRVLLVDGNLRSPGIHSLFEKDLVPGLCDLLKDSLKIQETLKRVDILGVTILPAGRVTCDPVELVGSPKMREVLSELEKEFNRILVDTPAGLIAADSALLSSMTDVSLFVSSSGQSTSREIQMAVRRIHSSGGKIIGMVMNRLEEHELDILASGASERGSVVPFHESLTT